MDDDFDPYHKWLGIPPNEQPPNYYRLLGVAPLETDLDVISNASDQRMSHLRTFQAGKHAALSQRVLNEIAAAKVCLLNPAKKQQYDQALLAQRAALARSQSPPPSPPPRPTLPPIGQAAPRPISRMPMPVAAPVEPPADLFGVGDDSLPSFTRNRKRRRQSSWLAPVVFLLLVIAGLGLGFAVVMRNLKPVVPPPGKNTTAKTGSLPGGVAPPSEAEKSHARPIDGSGTAHVETTGQPNQDPGRPDPDAMVQPSQAPANPPQTMEQLLARVAAEVDAGNVVETETVGVDVGTVFDEVAAGGGLLIGVKLTLGTIDQQPRVTSVQPIFWTAKGPKLGAVHGEQSGQAIELRGGPGLLVGGMNASGTDYVAGLELILMPVGKQGLDTQRATKTKWVGGRGPAAPVKLAGNGQAVVGLFGSAERSLTRLGLITEAYTAGDMLDATQSITENEEPMSGEETAPAFAEKNEAAKLPIPTGAPLKKARDQVRDLYRQDYTDAKSPEKKFALAGKLFSQAKATTDDPVAQYVLLDEARQLAAQVGDSEAALQAILGLASLYKVDDVGLTVTSLVEAEKAPTLGPIKKKLAENALKLVDKAVERERFDVAEKLAGVASRAANKAGDGILVEQAKTRAAALKPQAKAYAAVQEATATLKTTPEDAEANLAVGRYLCLVRDDWSAGLPMLAKASNAKLKTAAELELAVPGDGAELAHLGDLWVALAQSDPTVRAACQKRARLWYKRAVPQLAGLARAKVEKAIEDLSGGHGLKAEFFAGPGKFDEKLKTRIDPNIDFQWGQRDPDVDVNTPQFTVRWSGWIAAPAKGTYKLSIEHDDGARILIDGKLAIDGWAIGGRSELTLPLSRKAKAITIEYFNSSGPARAILRWSQVGGFAEQVVPTEALFHNFAAAQKGFGQEP